jgi:beta-1,4-N-acetylglucosaminyltransferase
VVITVSKLYVLMMGDKTVFVTVGTTLFEPLVAAVVSETSRQWMERAGYTRLVVQYGKGVPPVLLQQRQQQQKQKQLTVELYDFKPSLSQDMAAADLIVCHAGAGTLMEALQMGAGKKVIVTVINTALMDNHQTEVAHALSEKHFLYVVDDAADLVSHWDQVEQFQPVRYDGGDPHDIPRLLDTFYGLKAE